MMIFRMAAVIVKPMTVCPKGVNWNFASRKALKATMTMEKKKVMPGVSRRKSPSNGYLKYSKSELTKSSRAKYIEESHAWIGTERT
jgi:hypothetical protein